MLLGVVAAPISATYKNKNILNSLSVGHETDSSFQDPVKQQQLYNALLSFESSMFGEREREREREMDK